MGRDILAYFICTTFFFSSLLDIDECASGPCQNGGTCVDQVNGYLCQCAPGYADLQCQTGEGIFSQTLL